MTLCYRICAMGSVSVDKCSYLTQTNMVSGRVARKSFNNSQGYVSCLKTNIISISIILSLNTDYLGV